MKQLSQTMRAFLITAVLFLILVIVLPANQLAKHLYHLSNVQYHELLFVVVLPIIAVWFAAFYGYSQLRRYAISISDTRTSADFLEISRGIQWLAWSMPITLYVSLILDSIANHQQNHAAVLTIIINYVALFVPLIGFSILSTATRNLTNHSILHIEARSLKIILGTFVSIGVLYCFFLFRQLSLHHPNSTHNPFALPSWLVVLTITIPYLYAWFNGLLSAYEIGLYGTQSQGIIYRAQLNKVAVGLTGVIAGLIAQLFIATVLPQQKHLALNVILLINYAAWLVTGAGYTFIAFGAINLRRIEEI